MIRLDWLPCSERVPRAIHMFIIISQIPDNPFIISHYQLLTFLPHVFLFVESSIEERRTEEGRGLGGTGSPVGIKGCDQQRELDERLCFADPYAFGGVLDVGA